MSLWVYACSATPSPEKPPLAEGENPLYVQAGAPHTSPDVTVTIDYNAPLLKSNLTFGITHTHYAWQNGQTTAITNAKQLMKSLNGFQNTHIMGWGPGGIRTDINGVPGNLDEALTSHVDKVTELGQGMITFCTAPGWMKQGGNGDPNSTQGDWNMEQAVLPQYEDAYATLCAEIAKKYTQVTYFQVWNEFKGLWNASLNDWDYERYTRFYNKIYQKVKEVRPDALIGGFYQVVPGDGTAEILGSTGRDTNMPVDASTKRGIDYFLKNAVGMDFFCVDKGIVSYHNPNKDSYSNEQIIKLTPVWELFMTEIIKTLGSKHIPVIYSEYYASVNRNEGAGTVAGGVTVEQYSACQYASTYNHILRGSLGWEIWMLLWMEADSAFPQNAVFTATNTADGGKPKLHYWVLKTFNDRFNHADLLNVTTTAPDVEAIASNEATMVINRQNKALKVNVNGKGITLQAYGIALLEK